jgi:hypothetical protein
MFVLDTDILTLLFAGHAKVLSRRDSVPAADIAITVVSRNLKDFRQVPGLKADNWAD